MSRAGSLSRKWCGVHARCGNLSTLSLAWLLPPQSDATYLVSKVDSVIDPNPLHVLADVAQKEDGTPATGGRNPSVTQLRKWRAGAAEFLSHSEDTSTLLRDLEQLASSKSLRRGAGSYGAQAAEADGWAGEAVACMLRTSSFDELEALLEHHDVTSFAVAAWCHPSHGGCCVGMCAGVIGGHCRRPSASGGPGKGVARAGARVI